MESTTHKQLANSAQSKANQTSVKIGAVSRELDNVSEEDTAKKSGLQNRIQSLQNQAQGYQVEAGDHRSEATRAEIKENDKAFKELEAEQQAIEKEEAKTQQKIEKEAEEKALKAEKNQAKDASLNNDFGDELLFLSDANDFSPVATEDVIDFTVAKPEQAETQEIENNTKNNEEENLIKGAGAAATGS
jgi:hypothetical protein